MCVHSSLPVGHVIAHAAAKLAECWTAASNAQLVQIAARNIQIFRRLLDGEQRRRRADSALHNLGHQFTP